MDNKYKPKINEEILNRIIELHKQGNTDIQIAQLLSNVITSQAIRSKLKKMGLLQRYR
jgi:hypothetical protein